LSENDKIYILDKWYQNVSESDKKSSNNSNDQIIQLGYVKDGEFIVVDEVVCN
jgi:hypothetical protein